MTTSTLYSLRYSDVRTYIAASLFVVGNILLPQLLHVIPDGGVTWLPIYFFTLVGAFKFGWRAGLLMAVASPVVNSVLFGMPARRGRSSHNHEIGAAGSVCRLGGHPIPQGYVVVACRCCSRLSDARSCRRMDHDR